MDLSDETLNAAPVYGCLITPASIKHIFCCFGWLAGWFAGWLVFLIFEQLDLYFINKNSIGQLN